MILCKICQSPTEIQGCVDAGKSCETHNGVFLPLTGIPVWYHRCLACGFLFTPNFDHWTPAQFIAGIYNERYREADPEYFNGERARRFLPTVLDLMAKKGLHSVLDYGGGDGALTGLLSSNGKRAVCYEPLMGVLPAAVQPGSFDLVVAVEVLEHTPTPRETVHQAIGLIRPGGMMLFTTALCDGLPKQSTDWWYIAPRNGHVSIWSSQALSLTFPDGWWLSKLAEGVFLANS